VSAFSPNAVLSVFRDQGATESTDDWGYPVDDPNPAEAVADAAGLYAYVTQTTKSVFDPGTGQVTRIAQFTIRCRPGAFAFSESDRIRDERTGVMYQVNGVKDNAGVVQRTDIVLTCKRVN
jgi:hypothetical protein